MGICFFGYDPLQNQYKVLFLPLYYSDKGCHVFTLGGHHTSNQWRTIQGVSGYHLPLFGSVCTNGVIYYRAKASEKDYNSSIYELMSFDVRSEKFCNVDAPKTLTDHYSILINYKGKLGFVCCWNIMEIWIRDDGDHDQKTQGWSKIFLYEMEGFDKWSISGVTRYGEIVFVNRMYSSNDRLWVLYYDPERNCIRYMDLEGTHPIERRHHQNSIIVWTFPDYVENTMRLY
ncbi:LOW QUALITY PROTEIN: putative F-box protein At5g50220 [Capsella rubella]|uniref:LOW QUALITY PROTEIN: putative F-box protein At5g50220 n=1 Tax=Capsella rubella TaxID=81985 RepID=UPI000CD59E2A|nr:LOW QUALITY PROTEIN: putative F-box protein At5g50220 [Capsella rubella]